MAATLAWTIAACAPSTNIVSTTSSDPAAPTTGPAATAERVLVDPDALAEASRFWRSLALHGAGEVEGFSTLEEMTSSADLVVIGELGETVNGPVVVADEGEGSEPVTLQAVEVRVLEVLAGIGKTSESILFRWGFTGAVGDNVHRGPVILFLRSGASEFAGGAVMPQGEVRDWFSESYRLVSLQGAYLGTDQGMINPLSDEQYHGNDPVACVWVGKPVEVFIDAVLEAGQSR
ncbi:MAG: hypothetical protein L0Z47_04860 [Actinobacteria bacterium]|nr:hypothetical protein [Actinomycetota bacterium]